MSNEKLDLIINKFKEIIENHSAESILNELIYWTNNYQKNRDTKSICQMSLWLGILQVKHGTISIEDLSRGFNVVQLDLEMKESINDIKKHN